MDVAKNLSPALGMWHPSSLNLDTEAERTNSAGQELTGLKAAGKPARVHALGGGEGDHNKN